MTFDDCYWGRSQSLACKLNTQAIYNYTFVLCLLLKLEVRLKHKKLKKKPGVRHNERATKNIFKTMVLVTQPQVVKLSMYEIHEMSP